MKIFIYEHFSCGGAGRDNPLSIEGEAILRSAMRSFAEVPGAEPFTIENYASQFAHALAVCDGALIVAPETDGILENLTVRVETSGKLNLGCGADAIRATGDKFAFSRLMKSAGIPHPLTVEVGGRFDSSRFFAGAWVLKPADGAGAEGVIIHRQPRKVDALIGPHVAQEFVEGEPMSLSIVSGGGWLEVLSVNRQRFNCDEISYPPHPALSPQGRGYDGGEIMGEEPGLVLRELAERIQKAIPGLRGYWGVDFVMTQAGPVAIEVNPRLTTGFCGLADALNPTPGAFITAALNGDAPPATVTRRPVYFTKMGETRFI
jgi:predicted ATP-grasp superfamily ATP-dependent carboligase